MKYLFIFGTMLLLIIGTELFRKKSLRNLLKQIYTASIQKDEELFNLYLNSPQAKMLMSRTSRLMMKLNYYIVNDREAMVVKYVNKLKEIRMSNKNAMAFYSSTIGYYAEKQRIDTIDLLQHLKEKYQHTKNEEIQLLIMDCQLLYDIYIQKDASQVPVLQQIIQSNIRSNMKVIYMLRLARLYNFIGDEQASKKQLKEAYDIANPQVKEKIDDILRKGW